MIIYKDKHASRRVMKTVSTIPYRREIEYIESLTYSVDLDYRELDGMAHRAAINKTGVSICGPITVTIVKRERVQGVQEP